MSQHRYRSITRARFSGLFATRLSAELSGQGYCYPTVWFKQYQPLTQKGFAAMPYSYEGPATLTVSARYLDRDPQESITKDLHIVLQNVGVNRVRIQIPVRLESPVDGNVLRVQLPNGLMLEGPIQQGEYGDGGGWLEFNVEARDLGLGNPAKSGN